MPKSPDELFKSVEKGLMYLEGDIVEEVDDIFEDFNTDKDIIGENNEYLNNNKFREYMARLKELLADEEFRQFFTQNKDNIQGSEYIEAMIEDLDEFVQANPVIEEEKPVREAEELINKAEEVVNEAQNIPEQEEVIEERRHMQWHDSLHRDPEPNNVEEVPIVENRLFHDEIFRAPNPDLNPPKAMTEEERNAEAESTYAAMHDGMNELFDKLKEYAQQGNDDQQIISEDKLNQMEKAFRGASANDCLKEVARGETTHVANEKFCKNVQEYKDVFDTIPEDFYKDNEKVEKMKSAIDKFLSNPELNKNAVVNAPVQEHNEPVWEEVRNNNEPVRQEVRNNDEPEVVQHVQVHQTYHRDEPNPVQQEVRQHRQINDVIQNNAPKPPKNEKLNQRMAECNEFIKKMNANGWNSPQDKEFFSYLFFSQFNKTMSATSAPLDKSITSIRKDDPQCMEKMHNVMTSHIEKLVNIPSLERTALQNMMGAKVIPRFMRHSKSPDLRMSEEEEMEREKRQRMRLKQPIQNPEELEEEEKEKEKKKSEPYIPLQPVDSNTLKNRNSSLNSDLNSELEGLHKKHRVTNRGGSSSEHEKLTESVSELMDAATAKPYNPKAKADALLKARKAAMEYIKAKRGNNKDPHWKPKTRMGKERFEAAQNILERCNEEMEAMGLDGFYAEMYDQVEDMNKKHWYGLGGSSTEHRNMKKAMDKLMKASLTENPHYSEAKKAQALKEARLAAKKYIEAKRGNNTDPNWEPKTGMGKARYKAAQEMLEKIENEMQRMGILEAELEKEKQAAPSTEKKQKVTKDLSSIKESQNQLKTYADMDVSQIKKDFNKHKTTVLGLLADVVAKKMVYSPVEMENTEDYATNPELAEKTEKIKKGLIDGNYAPFNVMAANIDNPETLQAAAELASKGEANTFMHLLNTKFKKIAKQGQEAHRTSEMQRNNSAPQMGMNNH